LGDLAIFSALGPTADGRQKPDIAAPAAAIISSLSSDVVACTHQTQASCLPRSLIAPDKHHFVGFGTSAAAPHVAGTIALMLQADPALDPAAADAILRATARRDDATGTASWAPSFGAGKLDAFSAVQSVLQSPPPTAAAAPSALPASATIALDGAEVLAVQDMALLPASRITPGHRVTLVAEASINALPSSTVEWRFRLAAGHRSLYTRSFHAHYGQHSLGTDVEIKRSTMLPRSAPHGVATFAVQLVIGSSTQTVTRRVTIR
jgi:hypothetical protein